MLRATTTEVAQAAAAVGKAASLITGVDTAALIVSSSLQAAPTTTGTTTDDGGRGDSSRVGRIAVGVAAGLTALLAIALVVLHVRHPRGLKWARLPFRVSIRRPKQRHADLPLARAPAPGALDLIDLTPHILSSTCTQHSHPLH
jgi:hypothetical protein